MNRQNERLTSRDILELVVVDAFASLNFSRGPHLKLYQKPHPLANLWAKLDEVCPIRLSLRVLANCGLDYVSSC